MSLLTEFEIRRRVEDIEVSDVPPSQKARMILRLGRTVKLETRAHARALSSKVADPIAFASFRRRLSSLRSLYEDVRLAARRAYADRAGALGRT